MNHIYQAIQFYHNKGDCLLATVTEGEQAGEKLLLCGGETVFTSSENSLLTQRLDTLKEIAGSRLVTVDGQRVFVERFTAKPQLVICGGGTVGQALVSLASHLDFFITVMEDREEYAARAKELGADEVITESFDQGFSRITGGANTYFVVVTREHKYDTLCLTHILKKSFGYAGMMGSRKRTALIRQQLIGEGIPLEMVNRLYAPIGLSIGAETPEEIAVSILAQLIQCKSQNRQTEGYSDELLSQLCFKGENQQPRVLTQIVERIGSTPRDIGTKMLVYADGSHSGTIGGGWIEADVIQKALVMLNADQKTLLCHELLNTEGQGAANPMLCGGQQLVLMEKLTYENK